MLACPPWDSGALSGLRTAGVTVRGMYSEAKWPWLDFQLCHPVAVRLWTRMALCLGFPICRVGMILISPLSLDRGES